MLKTDTRNEIPRRNFPEVKNFGNKQDAINL